MPSIRGRELLGASKPWLQQLWASHTTDSCYFSSIYADHPSQNVKTRWHLPSGQAGVLLYRYNWNNKPSTMCAHRSSAVVRFSLSRFNWNRLDPLPYHWEWMWSLSATPLLPLSIPDGNGLPGSLLYQLRRLLFPPASFVDVYSRSSSALLQSVWLSFSSFGSSRLDLAGELVALLITSIHLVRKDRRNAQLLAHRCLILSFSYELYPFHQTSQNIRFVLLQFF